MTIFQHDLGGLGDVWKENVLYALTLLRVMMTYSASYIDVLNHVAIIFCMLISCINTKPHN
jgi:hypothetical protein